MKREELIRNIAEGEIETEELISYCKKNILDKNGLQSLMMDLWIAEYKPKYSLERNQELLERAIDIMMDYFGIFMCDGEENIVIKSHKDPEPIFNANNIDDVLKQTNIYECFVRIVKNKTQTTSELNILLQNALEMPVEDGVCLCPYQLAKGIKESLSEWLISKDGIRQLRAEELKKVDLAYLDEGVRILTNSIEERAKKWLLKVEHNEEQKIETILPKKLSNPYAEMIFKKAIEKGWIVQTSKGLEWKRQKVELAYFCKKVFCPTSTEHLPELALNRLFNQNRLQSALYQMDNAKKQQKWKDIIDEIFN